MNPWIYILVMAAATYAVRILPLILIRGEIKNRTVRSFLYYVPYATLSVMTVPAIIEATRTPWAGTAALVIGIVLAARGAGLLKVAVACCLAALIVEALII